MAGKKEKNWAMALGGLRMGEAFENEPEIQQLPTMTKQQKQAYSVMLQQMLSRLGHWVDTPKGKVFVYDPQRPPEYEGQVAAPLTGLQQQSIQDASNLGQQQRGIMEQGPTDYAGLLGQYQPGKIGELAGKLPQAPTLGDKPYQFNEMALTGMAPPRPEIPEPRQQYFNKNWRIPQERIAKSDAQAAGTFEGPRYGAKLAWDMENTPVWTPQQGPYQQPRRVVQGEATLPQYGQGYLLDAMGNPVIDANGQPIPAYAAGGFMPANTPSNVNLVGEAGPEMHIDQSGRRNMVGEHGTGLFDPDQGGQIIPNYALPGPMQTGMGPQANTGKEMPLPGQGGGRMPGQADGTQNALNSIANALIQPAMTLAGAGRQQGGPVDQPGDIDYDFDNMPEQYGEYWTPGAEGDEYRGSFDFGGDIYNMPWTGWGNWWQQTEQPFQESYGRAEEMKNFDWGDQPWTYGDGTWSFPGAENPYAPEGMTYNYGLGQYEMAGFGDPYQAAPYEGWTYERPGEGQMGPSMYVPGGYDTSSLYRDIPPETPPVVPVDPNAPPAFDWGTVQPYDPNALPQMTGQEWQKWQNPEYYNWMMETLNQTEPYYTADPEAIRGEWQSSVFEPGMETWRQEIQPIIEESYGLTGNVYGGRRPHGVTQALLTHTKNMEAEYGRMLGEGRQMEAEAYRTLSQNRIAAGQQYGALTSLPMQAMHTQALIDQINQEIMQKNIKLPIDIQQDLANVDLTNASTDAIYDKLTISNPLMSDKQKIENMVNLAYLDTMGTTRMGQELRNIGQALTNAGITAALGGQEQDVVQMLLSYSWNDWVNALGPDYENATNALLGAIGMPTVENFAMIPQTTNMDMSWLGQYLAGQNTTT